MAPTATYRVITVANDTTPLVELVDDSADRSSLSPAVADVVGEVFDPAADSVTLSLTRASAAAIAGTETPAPDATQLPGLPEVAAALVKLGGYARLREAGSGDGAPASRTNGDTGGRLERTDAGSTHTLLASDFLQASAYRSLGDAPLPPDRKAALYRTLTAGSADLARVFGAAGSGPDGDGDDRDRVLTDGTHTSPATILAGTGCALGGLVAGATRETVDAMGAYGRSLVAATERVDQDGHLLCRLEAVLTDRPATGAVADGDGDEPVRTDRDDPTVPAAALERARAALEELPDTPGTRRLERATFVPLEGVLGRR